MRAFAWGFAWTSIIVLASITAAGWNPTVRGWSTVYGGPPPEGLGLGREGTSTVTPFINNEKACDAFADATVSNVNENPPVFAPVYAFIDKNFAFFATPKAAVIAR